MILYPSVQYVIIRNTKCMFFLHVFHGGFHYTPILDLFTIVFFLQWSFSFGIYSIFKPVFHITR